MNFPDSPMFAGINAPSRVEADIKDLEIEGEIPKQIDGAFYRVGADHQFPPRFANDVPFNPRTATAPEGDRWIIQALTNRRTMRTELNLFVATEIRTGPIATVKLPLRLTPAYHGSWSDARHVKPSGLG